MAHPSTYDEIKKGAIFKALATKSMAQVGLEFEFDKYYKSTSGLRTAVHKIYREVQQDPQKFALSQDTIELVEQSMESRKMTRYNRDDATPTTLRETKELEENKTFSQLAEDGRNKIIKIIHKKLDMIDKSRKKLDNVSAGELAKVYSILFDKSQIIRGEATEHVKVLSKNIDDNLTPEERLDYVLKLREKNNEDKEKARKK